MKASTGPPTIPQRLRSSATDRPSNLIPALLLLPGDRRRDALLFGEWCRHVDDIADNHSLGMTEKKTALNAWLIAIGSDTGVPEDLRTMIQRRSLDRAHLAEIVRGMLMDTERNRYETFTDLEVYCRRVASAVGLTSAHLFGASGVAVESYAADLGIALQLTNILRDVAEDAAVDRIYLPQEDLKRFGVSDAELLGSKAGTPSPGMTHLLNHQAERADSYFAKAELAWSEMSANQKRLMRPARLMSAIYRDILLQMHRDRYDVFARRYRVPGTRKFLLLLRVMTSRN